MQAAAPAAAPARAPPTAQQPTIKHPPPPLHRQWIGGHGGFVHPALSVADPAPCGARGIVFSTAVAETDAQLQLGSLVVIPSALQLTGKYACGLFERLGGPSCLSRFSPTQQVAAGLAYELSLGAGSLWVARLAGWLAAPGAARGSRCRHPLYHI